MDSRAAFDVSLVALRSLRLQRNIISAIFVTISSRKRNALHRRDILSSAGIRTTMGNFYIFVRWLPSLSCVKFTIGAWRDFIIDKDEGFSSLRSKLFRSYSGNFIQVIQKLKQILYRKLERERESVDAI